MLKVEVSEHGIEKFEVHGNLPYIFADVTYIIAKIYYSLGTDDELVGDLFKAAIQDVIADDNSPVWNYLETERERKKAN